MSNTSSGGGSYSANGLVIANYDTGGTLEGVNNSENIDNSGNGIYIYSWSSGVGKITEIINSGVISGISTVGKEVLMETVFLVAMKSRT